MRQRRELPVVGRSRLDLRTFADEPPLDRCPPRGLDWGLIAARAIIAALAIVGACTIAIIAAVWWKGRIL